MDLIENHTFLLRAKSSKFVNGIEIAYWINPDGPPAADLIEAQAAELRNLRAELERRKYDGIHTCHADCQREACVLRREVEALRAGRDAEVEGRMTAIDVARYQVSKWIAESRGGSYLIPGYLRGELDDSKAIMDALTAIERREYKEPRA